MIIALSQAVLKVVTALPKFDVTTTTTTEGGKSLLWLIIQVKPGQVNSRGEDLPDPSYYCRTDVPLYTTGVEDSDVDNAVVHLKSLIRNNDHSNGWTNLI